MGADAEIHVFDYDHYRGAIVPALVEFLRTGTATPWLAKVIQMETRTDDVDDPMSWPHLAERLQERPVDLDRYCDWLGADLRYTGSTPVDRSVSKQLACASLSCPAREWCLLHRDQDRHGVEGLNALHEELTAVYCLGESQFVGRSVTPHFYLPVLERQDVPAGDPVRGLLAALATRGAVLGYQFGATEGIHGWLTVAETAELAAGLHRLDLPRYEPSFAAMASLFDARYRTHDGCARVHDDWREVSLSFVRTVATIAAGSRRGVLWGNDVCTPSWSKDRDLPDPRA
jgi:hypothetical protein